MEQAFPSFVVQAAPISNRVVIFVATEGLRPRAPLVGCANPDEGAIRAMLRTVLSYIPCCLPFTGFRSGEGKKYIRFEVSVGTGVLLFAPKHYTVAIPRRWTAENVITER